MKETERRIYSANVLNDEFVLKILTQMETDTVAPIFQAMMDAPGNKDIAVKRVVKLTEMMRLRAKK